MASYGDLTFATKSSTRTIKGLEFPCRPTNTGGFFSRQLNEDSIKAGLLQLLMTQRGERPMRLDYGTDLRRSVFAPLDSATISNMKSSILAAVERYEPRVAVSRFEIVPKTDNSQVDIIMVFNLKGDVLRKTVISLTVNENGVEING